MIQAVHVMYDEIKWFVFEIFNQNIYNTPGKWKKMFGIKFVRNRNKLSTMKASYKIYKSYGCPRLIRL
jgi:hypothetical protein